jgi:response regulator RpfG family c-di-GMP phosphodiesterase
MILAERGRHFDPHVVEMYMRVADVFRELSEDEPAREPRGFPASRTA